MNRRDISPAALDVIDLQLATYWDGLEDGANVTHLLEAMTALADSGHATLCQARVRTHHERAAEIWRKGPEAALRAHGLVPPASADLIVEAGVDSAHQTTKCDRCGRIFRPDHEVIPTCTATEYVTLCRPCYDEAGDSVR